MQQFRYVGSNPLTSKTDTLISPDVHRAILLLRVEGVVERRQSSTPLLLLREQFDPKDPWCVETLKWWDEQIFGASTTDDNAQDATYDAQGPSSRERALVERQKRMQAGSACD
jgi:hypothetical protein